MSMSVVQLADTWNEIEEPRTTYSSPANEIKWPADVDSSGYYGLAGELVGLIEPHTESDSVALLTQALVAFGNLVGRTPYFAAEADQHFCNSNVVLVGSTSKGRKGSSLGQIRRALSGIDEEW